MDATTPCSKDPKRDIMQLDDEDLQIFRAHARKFIEREIVPFHHQWEQDGVVPRNLWRAAGDAGLLCCTVPSEFGGPGADYRASAIVIEEMGRVGATGPGS
jgi:acyl-CoA dehydrogenase